MNEQTKRDLDRISCAAREDALRIIFDCWKLSVEKMAEMAKAGSVPHAKYLADWAGFTGAEPAIAEPKPAKKEESKKESEKKEEEGPSLMQLMYTALQEMKRGEWRPQHLDED